MKSFIFPVRSSSLLSFALSLLVTGLASADILVSTNAGTVARYRNDGSLVNASFISGLKRPLGVHVTGTHIFVVNGQAGTINRYNLDGSVSKVPFISGVAGAINVTADTTALYVSNYSAGKIGKYNLTTGAPINANLVTELGPIQGIRVSNGLLAATLPDSGLAYRYSVTTGSATGATASGLLQPTAITTDALGAYYIADAGTGEIAKYDQLFGLINGSFIASTPKVSDMTFVGNNLAVVNDEAGKVSLYGATGTLVKESFISGLKAPYGIAFHPVSTPQVKPTVAVTGKTTLTTSKPSITLKGTAKNATAVQVKVNGGKAIKITKVSPWSLKVNLKNGKNTILVTASGAGGKSKAVKVTVTRTAKKKSAASVITGN